MIIGVIGKANVGKSTFFNSATDQAVPSANYPFTTIHPNIGISFVREKCVCREFGVIDNPLHSICIDGNRFVPIKLIDIAGLVPGAHLGKGLGNKFLDDARQADALIHVVDASGSTDPEGRVVEKSQGDPLFDIKFVEEEFDQWVLSIVNRDWSKTSRDMANQKLKIEQILTKRLSGLSVTVDTISNALSTIKLINKNPDKWTQEDLLEFVRLIRKNSKPLLILANKADISTSQENIKKIKQQNNIVIPCASEGELVLRKGAKKGLWYYLPGDPNFELKDENLLNEQQKKALKIISSVLDKYGSTGVQEAINTVCFKLLNLIIVYPVEDEIKLSDKKGNILPNAFLLPKGSTAKDLATNIHEDLAKGFMFAIDVRNKQRIGADYELKHNDVIKIVSTTSRG
ncbi:MAG TPA: redox-regulated ATPase YchF [Nitrososphaeraceae archaeon]|jgi:ribosome-binding ATPase YchF (GTP1/OBG family)|nr:redox-regulated ATPase YchF [Nitrososphaeraceae archaeon]